MAAPSYALHRHDLPVVRSLAHQLEETAEHVHQYAEDQAHHFNHAERRMLRSLDRFHRAAARFHSLVESYFNNRSEVEAEVHRLNRHADRVEATLYRSHAMRHVIRDWERAERVLAEINRYIFGVERPWDSDRPFGDEYRPWLGSYRGGQSPSRAQ